MGGGRGRTDPLPTTHTPLRHLDAARGARPPGRARRYAQFVALRAKHPEAVLVPTADIALMWHTHLANTRHYAEACGLLLGGGGGGGGVAGAQYDAATLWRPSYMWLPAEQWWAGYVATKGLYEATYGGCQQQRRLLHVCASHAQCTGPPASVFCMWCRVRPVPSVHACVSVRRHRRSRPVPTHHHLPLPLWCACLRCCFGGCAAPVRPVPQSHPNRPPQPPNPQPPDHQARCTTRR